MAVWKCVLVLCKFACKSASVAYRQAMYGLNAQNCFHIYISIVCRSQPSKKSQNITRYDLDATLKRRCKRLSNVTTLWRCHKVAVTLLYNVVSTLPTDIGEILISIKLATSIQQITWRWDNVLTKSLRLLAGLPIYS